jgi:hypothetical protein
MAVFCPKAKKSHVAPLGCITRAYLLLQLLQGLVPFNEDVPHNAPKDREALDRILCWYLMQLCCSIKCVLIPTLPNHLLKRTKLSLIRARSALLLLSWAHTPLSTHLDKSKT